MKKFGSMFEEFIRSYQEKNPELDVTKETEIVILKNWNNFFSDYSQKNIVEILKHSEFVWLKKGILQIKTTDASAKFMINMDKKNILRFINEKITRTYNENATEVTYIEIII